MGLKRNNRRTRKQLKGGTSSTQTTRETRATRAAKRPATKRPATTRTARQAATTRAATTRAATRSATRTATQAATRSATRTATQSATQSATRSATAKGSKRGSVDRNAATEPIIIGEPQNPGEVPPYIDLNFVDTSLIDNAELKNVNGRYIINLDSKGGTAVTYYKETKQAKYMIKYRFNIDKKSQQNEVDVQMKIRKMFKKDLGINIPNIIYSDTEKGIIIMEYLNNNLGWNEVYDDKIADDLEKKFKNKGITTHYDFRGFISGALGTSTSGTHIFSKKEKGKGKNNKQKTIYGIIDFGNHKIEKK